MKLIVRYPVLVLLLALGLAALAVPLALRLSLDTEIVDLLPPDLPSVRSFRIFEHEVGGHTFLSIVVESPDPAANQRFALALAERLQRRDWVYQVEARRELAFVQARWPFLVPVSTLRDWEGTLQELVARIKVRQSPLALDLTDDSGGWDELRTALNSGVLAPLHEFRTNADGTVLLIQVQLRELTSNTQRARTILTQAKQDIADTSPAQFHTALRARPYGGLAFRLAEYDAILADLARASLITLPIILLLPALIMRSWWGPLIILAPLTLGTVGTYAAANAAFGALNLVTAFLFLVLFGIGDDYPIHLFYCIRDETRRRPDARAAMAAAIHATKRPLLYSALTDAAAFAGLTWMQFRGFSHFGATVATGILLVLVSTFLCVPGLTWLIRTRRELRQFEAGATSEPTPKPRLSANFLVAIWVVMIVVATAFAVFRAQFENDFERLRPNFAELRELREKAETIPGFQKSSPAVFLTQDLERSRKITHALQVRLDAAGETAPIAHVLSLAMFFDDAAERRAHAENILKILRGPVFARAPEDLRRQLDPLVRNVKLSPMTLDDVPASVRRSLTRPAADGAPGELYLVVAEPRYRVSIADNALAFSQAVSGVSVDSQPQGPAGEALILAEIMRLVREESIRVLLISCVLSSMVLLLAFRSGKELVLMLVTVSASIGMTMGLLAALGIRLSFFNVVVFPILFGVGMDYGIHVLHRAREQAIPAMQAAAGLSKTIASASATTALGFLGLLFAHHPGLRSLGITALLGIMLTAMNCLIFLPALRDAVFTRRGERALGQAIRR